MVNCQTIDLLKCGSDGYTYRSSCFVELASHTIENLTFTDGACAEEKELPSYLYRPVCGSDNVTYNNSCELDEEQKKDNNLTKVFDGECNESCDVYKPVCGGDGLTYNNNCNFREAQKNYPGLVKVSDTECSDDVLCNTNYYQPLCASNGVTYNRVCEFNKAKKITDLYKVNDGECDSASN